MKTTVSLYDLEIRINITSKCITNSCIRIVQDAVVKPTAKYDVVCSLMHTLQE